MTALTLITSVLNGRPYIAGMLASVPDNPGIEHIVIDAGSTDGTLDDLNGRHGIRLIKHPGIPLYGAWNEAVKIARSPFVAFLNADDELPLSAVDIMLDAIGNADETDVFCGEAKAFIDTPESAESDRRIVCDYTGEQLTALYLPVLVFGASVINAKVFRRQLVIDAGGFDTSLAFAADREFLLRLALSRPRPQCMQLPDCLYHYRIHRGSKTLAQSARRRVETAREHMRIAARLYARRDLAKKTRKLLRAWRTRETMVTLCRGFAAGDKTSFLGAVRAAGGLVRAAPHILPDLIVSRKARRACLAPARSRDQSPKQAG